LFAVTIGRIVTCVREVKLLADSLGDFFGAVG
jgi:hypothetical protein